MNTAYKPSNTALCFQDFKQAALYFERVLPLNFGRMRGDSDQHDIMVGYPEEIPSVALSHLVDGIEGDSKTYFHAKRVIELFGERWGEFASSVRQHAKLFLPLDRMEEHEFIAAEYSKLQAAYFSDAGAGTAGSVRKCFQRYAESIGFKEFCVVLPARDMAAKAEQIDPSLTLAGLSLIDAGNADWRQIIEIRKDVDSHRKLANLRLFIHKDYAGKSFSYIEDDLSQKIYEYEMVTRKFGFQTVTSSLSILLDAKALQASIGSGLVAGLFGGPLLGLSTTAVVELGKVAINIAEKRHEFRRWREVHELAYIFDCRKNLS